MLEKTRAASCKVRLIRIAMLKGQIRKWLVRLTRQMPHCTTQPGQLQPEHWRRQSSFAQHSLKALLAHTKVGEGL